MGKDRNIVVNTQCAVSYNEDDHIKGLLTIKPEA
jgi:hypothetical protein